MFDIFISFVPIHCVIISVILIPFTFPFFPFKGHLTRNGIENVHLIEDTVRAHHSECDIFAFPETFVGGYAAAELGFGIAEDDYIHVLQGDWNEDDDGYDDENGDDDGLVIG